MTHKVAVAIVHGIGGRAPHFADRMIRALDERCRAMCGDGIVMRGVYWQPVLQDAEDVLWERLLLGGAMDFTKLRRFMVDFLADAAAYQITPHDRRAYDGIHRVFAETLKTLAQAAGATAPLCVIAHSLGTVIASNYLYDLQVDPVRTIVAPPVREIMTDTPLERGETLTLLYTLGSPLALWSLRYDEFGKPIDVPDPRLVKHYPDLIGEWVNFYDEDDVFGFPLKTLNPDYDRAVTVDWEVNVGDLLGSWNPLAHFGYWDDTDVIDPIARALIRTWQGVNA